MKINFLKAISIALISIAVISCKDSTTTDNSLELLSITSAESGDYILHLSGLKPLETGYNRLFWDVSKAGTTVEIDSILVNPIMDMTTMTHSCPKETPFSSQDADGKFEGYMVFIMPSGDMGSWAITATAYLSNGESFTAAVDISVANSWKLQSFTYNEVKYFVSWASPDEPFVGKNTVQLMLHKKATMMSFPSTDDLSLSIYPYMDMGSGEGHSAPYEQVERMGTGHYKGSISYSMSGDWQITVSANSGSETVAETVFNMNVISK
ncbi:hypothetical protein EP331_03670 [bacterium]|nr:MAG: hypothetical protein EP331_03670 [bacterium]